MRGKRLALAVVVVAMLDALLVVGGAFGGLFLIARRATEQEWQSKLEPRTAAEMRGMIESLTMFRSEPANFLPHSMLDDEACAALVSNAINFILGEDRIKPYPAWLFYKANASALEIVRDRSKSFTINHEEGRVVEWQRPVVSLSDELDQLEPNGLYVLGYHYRQTRSDSKIIAANSDLNSHVMLLLNNLDGRWWGYHLIHRPEHETENPVRVEPIDEMDKDMDLVYVWKVKDVTFPDEGADVFLMNNALPYSWMLPWLGHGGSLEYYADTVTAWIFDRIHGTEQFPRVVNLREWNQVEILKPHLFHGKILAFYKGVPIYFNHGASNDGKYGREFQCVEFVNRFLVSLGHRNLRKTGHADSYFWNAKEKGLRAFPNNGMEKPQEDDLIVFDRADNDGSPGHVAVISFVSESFLCFVQQNVGTQWRKCLLMSQLERRWTVETQGSNIPIPVAGWVRR